MSCIDYLTGKEIFAGDDIPLKGSIVAQDDNSLIGSEITIVFQYANGNNLATLTSVDGDITITLETASLIEWEAIIDQSVTSAIATKSDVELHTRVLLPNNNRITPRNHGLIPFVLLPNPTL